jgi:hypothetical protein
MLCVYLRGENEHENENGYKREGKTRDKKLFKSADCDVPFINSVLVITNLQSQL